MIHHNLGSENTNIYLFNKNKNMFNLFNKKIESLKTQISYLPKTTDIKRKAEINQIKSLIDIAPKVVGNNKLGGEKEAKEILNEASNRLNVLSNNPWSAGKQTNKELPKIKQKTFIWF